MLLSFVERLQACRNEIEVMRNLMDYAADIMGAAKATAQLVEPDFRYLEIVAQRGFAPEFENHFRRLDRYSGTMCGRAMLTRAPIVVEDALADAASQRHKDIFENANVRAVVSMPVITPRGTFCGMVSTHKPVCHVPSRLQINELKHAASTSAEAILKIRVRQGLNRDG
jgi:GAF domain-containing protein